MKTVKVIRYFNNELIDFTYAVDDGENFPGERDLSGTYVELSEAEVSMVRLEFRLGRIVDVAEAIDFSWVTSGDNAALRDELKAAIEAAREALEPGRG